jgi:transposase
MKKTCGECGFTGKAGKQWRVRGQWVRCPKCVKIWSAQQQQSRDLDREWEEATG